ncbi:MAG: mechanosensitive ion channel family protein [Calditrichaceae bacterium]
MDFLHSLGLDFSHFFTEEKTAAIIRFLALIFIGLPLTFMLSKSIKKYFTKKLSAQQGMIFGKLVMYSGVVIIIFSILNDFGFKLSHLLGAAGIVGIALGFASQTSVSNIISGLFLIAEKPFMVDDVITVGGTTGQVLSIDVLSIKLRTFDNKFIRIPNETIIKSEVTNVTRFPIRRLDVNIGVAYKEDVKKVKSVLLNIADKNPLCLQEPEPLIIFSGFGDSSIDFLFAVWAVKADYLKLKNSILEEIKNGFDEEGIEIPFPHISLYTGSETKPFPVTITNNDAPVTHQSGKKTE